MKEKVRAGMVRQFRKNLARCHRVVIDQNMDLKTRERWTQLYNNTSQVLNQILKDSKSGAVAIQNLEQSRSRGSEFLS